MTKQTNTISGAWPFHDKTDKYYVRGFTIWWQNRLILYLGLDHFMTKETDTMSGARSFHDKTDWYYVCGLTISCQNQLILCLGLHHFTTKHTDAMSGAWPFHDKQTDTMSGDWSFHDKTHWYHVWSLTISWQNTLIPCLELDHFMTKHTDTMPGARPFHDKRDFIMTLLSIYIYIQLDWEQFLQLTSPSP
jgi:hypothetical protein